MPVKSEELKEIYVKSADIPSDFRLDAQRNEMGYLINGQLKKWTGAFQDVFSPIQNSDGGQLVPIKVGRFPLLSQEEALAALDAACQAYNDGRGEWPTSSVKERIACVKSFMDRMVSVRSEVIKLLMWEICKTLSDAEKEFDRTVEYIRATIEELKQLDRDSSRFAIHEGVIGQIRRSPLGVVLCMGPFNYPLNETFTTLIPSLIMGNTVVVKPPKLGVLLHAPLLQAFRDCFPKGVINFISGDGATIIGPIMKSGKLNVLAFIGTSKVADILRQQHPVPHRLRCVLGLEAKNPALILSDADIESAVKECVLGSFSYNGQRCTAIKIIFVHKSLGDKFVEKFANAVDSLRSGLPWSKGVQVTPLPEPGKTKWMNEYIQDALDKGAQIANKKGGLHDDTFFFPTVLFPSNKGMKIHHQEQFGPIVPVLCYEDENDFIDYVTESPFGQQVSLFGRDAKKLGFLIDSLVNQVSRINVNSQCQRGPDTFPFTGRKDSAEGTLSVFDALRAFSIRALVATKSDETNESVFTEIVSRRYSRFLSNDFIF